MEERVVGGKDKKYVLYTVVGEERGRAGVGVWVVRVLLATLLLVALAVVPYVSLRLAQVNDRTLVVFQPVPVHNHSVGQHHKDYLSKSVHFHGNIESASHSKNNSTTTALPKTNTSVSQTVNSTLATNSTSSTIVTLHEAAVTLAVLEETNTTVEESEVESENKDIATTVETPLIQGANLTTSTLVSATPNETITTTILANINVTTTVSVPTTGEVKQNENNNSTNTDPTTLSQNISIAPQADVVSTPAPDEIQETTAVKLTPAKLVSVNTTPKSSVEEDNSSSSSSTKVDAVSTSKSSSIVVPSSPATTPPVKTTTVSSTHKPLAHKLVYIAVTASGNHVGGFAVWKTDKTVTDWSYFYENIPIEYQSYQDITDHDLRGILAGVRTWSDKWQDYHVIIRSHSAAIENSNHPTKHQLDRELDSLSDGHFTYELEWRTRKSDKLVLISYCLSRLNRGFARWMHTFQSHVDELLGEQDWSIATKKHRAFISQAAFATDQKIDDMSSDNKVNNDQIQPLLDILKPSSLSSIKY